MNWIDKTYSRLCSYREGATPKRRKQMFFASYTLLFLAAFVFAYSPMLFSGKSFIWQLDGREQHFPTLMYFGRYLREIVSNIFAGRFELPMVDTKLAWGGDIIATLNYYGLGDPLYLTSVFVPAKYTEYLYDILIVVRLYLAGLSFCALCSYHKKSKSASLIGSVIYLFSGYAVFSAVRHPYFINPMIQLPLLIVGVDMIIRKKRPFVFIFSVLYTALCGFYFLYIMTVMLAVYALCVFFSVYRVRRVREFFAMIARIAAGYALGVGISAVIFLPSAIGFLTCGRFGASIRRNYLHYRRSYYEANLFRVFSPSGSWNALSLSTLVFPSLVMFLSKREKRYRPMKIMLAVSLVTYVLPLGGYIMNGFGYPTQRWTFGAVLLLSFITVEMFPLMISLDKKERRICMISTAVFILLSAAEIINLAVRNTSYRELYIETGMVFAALVCAILVIASRSFAPAGDSLRRTASVLCAFFVCANTGVYAIFLFSESKTGYIEEFRDLGYYTQELENSPEMLASVCTEPETGRCISPLFTVNTGAVCGVSTLDSYWSITNASVCGLAVRSESLYENCSSISGLDTNTALTTLLSARYAVAENDDTALVPYGYELINRGSDYSVYENRYALPWGYTYDSYIDEDAFEKVTGAEASSLMLKTIALADPPENMRKSSIVGDMTRVQYKITGQNGLEWKDGVLNVTEKDASVTLECRFPGASEGFVRLNGLNINGAGKSVMTVTAEAGGVKVSEIATGNTYNWYFGRENYLFALGYDGNERRSCTITFGEPGEYKLKNIELFALPMHRYVENVQKLRREPLENISWGTNTVFGTVSLSENRILCMSIPYSSGWRAEVDGKEAKIQRGNGIFMALPLEKGEHTVQFFYCTPGLKAGAAVTAFSAAVLIAAAAVDKRRRKIQ